MELYSKPIGEFESEATEKATPPGLSLVGNPKAGEWKKIHLEVIFGCTIQPTGCLVTCLADMATVHTQGVVLMHLIGREGVVIILIIQASIHLKPTNQVWPQVGNYH